MTNAYSHRSAIWRHKDLGPYVSKLSLPHICDKSRSQKPLLWVGGFMVWWNDSDFGRPTTVSICHANSGNAFKTQQIYSEVQLWPFDRKILSDKKYVLWDKTLTVTTVPLYTVSRKNATLFLPLTLSNTDWFLKFFHWQT